MVPKKKEDHGFNGYRVTTIPKAPRSIRKRGHIDLVEESKFCAFDLLATVAGKLLQGNETSASSNADERTVQPVIFCDENEKQKFVDDRIGQQTEKNSILDQTSSVLTLQDVNKTDSNFKLGSTKVEKVEEHSSLVRISDGFDCKPQCGPEMYVRDKKNHQTNTLTFNPTGIHVNTNTVINSGDSVQHLLDPTMRKHLNNVDVGTRDDDENYSGCNKSSTKIRSFHRPQPRIGNSRIRKVLAYKHRRSDQILKDRGLYSPCENMKAFYKYRKRNYKLQRLAAHHTQAKKRKLSDNGIGIAIALPATLRSPEEDKGRNVKFSIKSFQVPELSIEVPENTTFCSLKSVVMETVTSIFGSGFQVGVVLRGKKVQDDKKTLVEAGICHGSNLGALSFTLKPNFTNVSPSMAAKSLSSLLPQHPDSALPWSPATPMIDSGISGVRSNDPFVSEFNDNVGNCEFESSPQTLTNETMNGVVTNSKAILPVPTMNAEALAVVPVSKKPKHYEQSQRRIRRPFTVDEVEALVEAVEKLGTGRWRDVKMGAFEHADHRTYVDLKDKWKTLVHTASIAPQQRRGQPVPQNLLDRVLAAHSYWVSKSVETTGKEPSVPDKLLKTETSRAPEMLQA